MLVDKHSFWLDNFNDHLKLINNRLTLIGLSYRQMIATLYGMISAIQSLINLNVNVNVNQQCMLTVDAIYNFYKSILVELLNGQQIVNLQPTFINNMIDQCQEYKYILTYHGEYNTTLGSNILKIHKLWLNNAYLQADFIYINLDIVEDYREQVKVYRKSFHMLSEKCKALLNYHSNNYIGIPEYTENCYSQVLIFIEFLKYIQDRVLLGNIDSSYIQHIHKQCMYYLNKISIK